MKYYYNGELVRTSDHTYTHAVLDTKTGKVIACRNGADKAELARVAEVSLARGDIRYYDEMIRAMKLGRRYFFYNVGRMKEKTEIDEAMTIEKAYQRIDQLRAWIEKRLSELVVVPLEAR